MPDDITGGYDQIVAETFEDGRLFLKKMQVYSEEVPSPSQERFSLPLCGQYLCWVIFCKAYKVRIVNKMLITDANITLFC